MQGWRLGLLALAIRSSASTAGTVTVPSTGLGEHRDVTASSHLRIR